MDLPFADHQESCGGNWLLGTLGSAILRLVLRALLDRYPSGDVGFGRRQQEHGG